MYLKIIISGCLFAGVLASIESSQQVRAPLGRWRQIYNSVCCRWPVLNKAFRHTIRTSTNEQDCIHTLAGLLEKGAYIETKSSCLVEFTPLILAVNAHKTQVVKFLLQEGADINGTTSEIGKQKTALMCAAQQGYFDVVKLLCANELVNINAQDFFNNTALLLAVMHDHSEVALTLIEFGADSTIGNIDGWTPLSLGAFHGLGAVVKLLLDKQKWNPSTHDTGGYTLFQHAEGQSEVLKILQEYQEKLDPPTLQLPPCAASADSKEVSGDEDWEVVQAEG